MPEVLLHRRAFLRRATIVLTALGATVAALGAQARAAAAPPAIVIVRAARLIDGRGGAPLEPAMVRIDGERITAVGRSLPVPAGARLIDLGGATLLPGLIDLHTHLTGARGVHWRMRW